MRTLMVTVGATPQVVTETVHALIEQGWVPQRIILVTTLGGERVFAEGTPPLVGTGGRLAALYAARAPHAPVPEAEILVPQIGGAPVSDIRTEPQVTAFAETMLNAIAEVTADPESELHLSLAGGRKTMSFLAGSVLSFYGRPRDRLSHVLVEPEEFESSNLWWPGQPEPVTTRSGKTLDPNDARVLLHEVPYVRLAPRLRAEQVFPGGGPGGYAEAVARANEALGVDRITIDLVHDEVIVGNRRFPGKGAFDERGMAMLSLVALASRRGERLGSARHTDGNDALALDGDIGKASRRFAWFYAILTAQKGDEPFDFGDFPGLPGAATRFAEYVRQCFRPIYDDEVSQLMSRVKRQFRSAFGQNVANFLVPKGVRLGVAASNIEIITHPELVHVPGNPLQEA